MWPIKLTKAALICCSFSLLQNHTKNHGKTFTWGENCRQFLPLDVDYRSHWTLYYIATCVCLLYLSGSRHYCRQTSHERWWFGSEASSAVWWTGATGKCALAAGGRAVSWVDGRKTVVRRGVPHNWRYLAPWIDVARRSLLTECMYWIVVGPTGLSERLWLDAPRRPSRLASEVTVTVTVRRWVTVTELARPPASYRYSLVLLLWLEIGSVAWEGPGRAWPYR